MKKWPNFIKKKCLIFRLNQGKSPSYINAIHTYRNTFKAETIGNVSIQNSGDESDSPESTVHSKVGGKTPFSDLNERIQPGEVDSSMIY
jgi:hypothetical protein